MIDLFRVPPTHFYRYTTVDSTVQHIEFWFNSTREVKKVRFKLFSPFVITNMFSQHDIDKLFIKASIIISTLDHFI